MKIFKKILCLFLVLGIGMFSFSACGKNSDAEEEYNDPNENYENEMSINEVLGAVYSSTVSACSREYGSTTCFKDLEVNGENLYNCFVEVQLEMLYLLSENENLQTETYLYSEESTYAIKIGFANKLEMLYISRENEDYENDIKIYMVFSKSGKGSENLSGDFLMFYYEIEYNEKSGKTSVECYAENSEFQQYSTTKTVSEYYYLSYNSSENFLYAVKVKRLFEFDYSDTTQYYKLNNFTFLLFNTYANSEIQTKTSLADDIDAIYQVKSILEEFDQVELKTQNLEENLEIQEEDKVCVSGLTDEIILTATAMVTDENTQPSILE